MSTTAPHDANGNESGDANTGIKEIKEAVGGKAAGAYSYAQRSLDRFVPPSRRQRAYDNTSDFASARPILFSFIVSQLVLSFLPVLLFATFTISTIAFALGTALLFTIFWIGVAFLVLIPALLVTSSVAVLVWGWALGSFVIARWLYKHSPIGVRGDADITAGGKRINIVKDEKGVDGKIENTNCVLE